MMELGLVQVEGLNRHGRRTLRMESYRVQVLSAMCSAFENDMTVLERPGNPGTVGIPVAGFVVMAECCWVWGIRDALQASAMR